LYQESGRLRVGAIVNETTPITVTWQTSHDPTVLTVSMAEAAGIADVSSGEAVPITLAQGRQFIARRVAVPSIRLGSLVLQNVPALILPPDGEDLGAQLGLEALGDHYARVELEKLRLLIDPK
jgi:predicted aspartyl protease